MDTCVPGDVSDLGLLVGLLITFLREKLMKWLNFCIIGKGRLLHN